MPEATPNNESTPNFQTWTQRVRDRLSQENIPSNEIDQTLPATTSPLEAFIFNLVANTNEQSSFDVMKWIVDDPIHKQSPESTNYPKQQYVTSTMTSRLEALFGEAAMPAIHFDKIRNLITKYTEAMNDPQSLISKHLAIRKKLLETKEK